VRRRGRCGPWSRPTRWPTWSCSPSMTRRRCPAGCSGRAGTCRPRRTGGCTRKAESPVVTCGPPRGSVGSTRTRTTTKRTWTRSWGLWSLICTLLRAMQTVGAGGLRPGSPIWPNSGVAGAWGWRRWPTTTPHCGASGPGHVPSMTRKVRGSCGGRPHRPPRTTGRCDWPTSAPGSSRLPTTQRRPWAGCSTEPAYRARLTSRTCALCSPPRRGGRGTPRGGPARAATAGPSSSSSPCAPRWIFSSPAAPRRPSTTRWVAATRIPRWELAAGLSAGVCGRRPTSWGSGSLWSTRSRPEPSLSRTPVRAVLHRPAPSRLSWCSASTSAPNGYAVPWRAPARTRRSGSPGSSAQF